MTITDIVLKRVIYYMQSLAITVGSTQFIVPRTMIVSLDTSKNYDTMYYAMWYLSVNVPRWFYTQMANDPKNITVSMNLQYGTAETNEQLTSTTNALTTEISGSFKAIFPGTTQVADSSVEKLFSNDTEAYGSNYSYNEYAIAELALYNTNSYNASTLNLNAVLQSVTLTDCATYCFNQAGITNIYLSTPDNTTRYSEFKILPTTALNNLVRIVEDYNFHSAGSTFFFDLSEAYLVTNALGCKCWGNNECKATYFISLSEYDTTLGIQDGVYTNNTEKYHVVSINRDTYECSKIDNSPVISKAGLTDFIQIRTGQAIMGMITPNKEFIVNVDSAENSTYNGKYRLYSLAVNFLPQGEFLEPNFTIQLVR